MSRKYKRLYAARASARRRRRPPAPGGRQARRARSGYGDAVRSPGARAAAWSPPSGRSWWVPGWSRVRIPAGARIVHRHARQQCRRAALPSNLPSAPRTRRAQAPRSALGPALGRNSQHTCPRLEPGPCSSQLSLYSDATPWPSPSFRATRCSSRSSGPRPPRVRSRRSGSRPRSCGPAHSGGAYPAEASP